MQRIVKKHFNVCSIIVMLMIIIISAYYGSKKHGFYIDEYYLYTVANGNQLGIDITLGQWNDTSEYMKQLVSEPGENYQFDQVYYTESNNVHPPLYYYMLHFVSSVFTGEFSKWIGIGLNILILVPTLFVTRKIAWILSGSNEMITLITICLFGLSPATLSMTVLVRMYLLVGLWTMIYAYIHIADLERESLSYKGFIFPLIITGFLGFLTQYFFVVIMFFITFVYAFYLFVFCHRVRDTLIYCMVSFLSLVSTYFVWPFSYFHIFKGYRGKGAMSQIRDFAHIWERLAIQIQWLNKMVFSGTLYVFSIFFLIGCGMLVRHFYFERKNGNNSLIRNLSLPTKGFILIGIAAMLNFFVLSQISLMDGIMCCRHIYTSYSLFLILIPSGVYSVIKKMRIKVSPNPTIITAVLVAIVVIAGHFQKNVLFLFEDENKIKDYISENPDIKLIMFTGYDGNYDSRIQELIMVPEVYYIEPEAAAEIEDPVIVNADELLVFVPNSADPDECFDSIYKKNQKISRSELMMECYSFFNVYMLD